ncbi:hypothetical protein ES703_24979 [subsurface metagenome]
MGKTEVKAFYSLEAQAIYQACLDLEKEGKAIGLPTVHEVLKKKGKGKVDLPFLESLTSYATENEAVFEQELKDIRQYALHRRALGMSLTMEGKDYEQINEELREYLEECQEALSQGKDERPRSLTQDLKDGIPEIRYLVGNGLLPCEGYSMVCGKAKNRKTTLVLYFALCLATKTPVLLREDRGKQYAFPTLQKGKTLYLYGEGQAGFVLKVLKCQKEGLEKLIERDITEEETDLIERKRNKDVFLDTEEGITALKRLLKAEHYDLVIIDPLSLFTTGDIDRSQSAVVVVRTLETLSLEFGCLFLIVHHGRKDSREKDKTENEDIMDNILGSSSLRNHYEGCIFIERRGKKTASLLKQFTFEFRNAESPLPMNVMIDPKTHIPFPKDDREILSISVVDVPKLADFLRDELGGEAYPTELVDLACKHFEVKEGRIFDVLAEGKVRGVFEKDKGRGGKWRLVGKEEELTF